MSWKNVQRNTETGQYRTHEGSGDASALTDLTDVNVSSPSDGQVLKYDSTTQKWKNEDESGGGGTVTDVKVDGQSVVNPQTGEAEITMPSVPVQDVQVDGTSVVNQQGVAEITMPTPPTPDYPVTDVKVNGTSVVSNKQALITSYKEVTQAQYEALPDTKLSDNILYAIKDGGQAIEGFPPLIYSDEEREVGVWRDGKPLYQKTLTVTITSKVQWIETNIDTDSFIVDSRGVLITPNLTNGLTILPNGDPLGLVGIGTIFKDILSTGTFSLLYRTTSDSLGSGTAYITLWYTKSSDTPGSGTWNQQGAISHHYSTSEKVIGTWMNKPLYELSLELTNTNVNSEVNIDVSSYNIDFLINSFGSYSRKTGNFYAIYSFGHYESSSHYGWFRLDNNSVSGTKNTRLTYKIIAEATDKQIIVLQYTKTTD